MPGPLPYDPNPYVTRSDLDKAIEAVREDINETEQRLRREWTDAVRYEVGRVTDHLTDQDTKINWTLGLIVSLLLLIISALLYAVFSHA